MSHAHAIRAGAAEVSDVAKETDGYGIVDGVMGEEETQHLWRTLESSQLFRGRAGVRHLMRHPAVRAAAHDDRLMDIARTYLGSKATPYRATLFDKALGRNWLVAWHQDTALPIESRRELAGWGPWSAKAGVTYAHAPSDVLSRLVALRVHLDDSCRDNGPLRVIPGTHRLGVLTDAEVAATVAKSTPVDCLVRAGGVVAMRPLIIHASSKAESSRSRRVLHIEYADGLDVATELRIAIA